MFKTARSERQPSERGEATRERILEAALKLFRKKGFETATMRDIARAAKVSLGNAYYYYPSKEALVHAFYESVQRTHWQRVQEACSRSDDLLERVRSALLSKLEIVKGDRLLLGALFRFVGEPGHPLSVFGEDTRQQREESIAVFAAALEGDGLSPQLHQLAARTLWLAHLGLILHFIHDTSKGQERTLRLANKTAELFSTAIRLASMPGASLLLKPVIEALDEAGLTAPATNDVASTS